MPLKIMTYNTDMRGSKKPSLAGRIDSLINFINVERPDIICLQEFGSAAQAGITNLSKSAMGYNPFVGDRDVVTLFNIDSEILDVDHIKLLWNIKGGRPIFTKGTLIGKGYSIFKLTLPAFQGGTPFTIINTHLDPHDKNHGKRVSAFHKMDMSHHFAGCSTKIIAGDFNEPEIWRFCVHTGYNYDTESMVTHHHNDNVRRKSKNKALRKDWVVCKGATILAGSVETTRIRYCGEDVSDHSPVITTLF